MQIRTERSAVYETPRCVRPCQRHHCARHGLVASAEGNARVGHVAFVHDFDAIRNPISGNKAVAHSASPLRVPVADDRCHAVECCIALRTTSVIRATGGMGVAATLAVATAS